MMFFLMLLGNDSTAAKNIILKSTSPRQRQGVTIYEAFPIHHFTGNFLSRVYFCEQV
jgi:hypothetical protein